MGGNGWRSRWTGRHCLPAAGELFRVDRGLCAGAGTDETAVGDQLGRPAERLSRAVGDKLGGPVKGLGREVKPGAQKHFKRNLSGRLFLAFSSVGVATD